MFTLNRVICVTLLFICLQTDTTSWFGNKKSEPKNQLEISMQEQDLVTKVKQTIAEHKNIVVVFTTQHCPFCKYITPIMKQVEKKYPSLHFEFVDITQQKSAFKSEFKFSTVPTVIYYKDGKVQLSHGSDNATITNKKIEQNIANMYGI